MARSEIITISEAAERYGIPRYLFYQMVERGILTGRRHNPHTRTGRSRLQLFADEVQRYCELVESDATARRIEAAMKQFRREAGRLKK